MKRSHPRDADGHDAKPLVSSLPLDDEGTYDVIQSGPAQCNTQSSARSGYGTSSFWNRRYDDDGGAPYEWYPKTSSLVSAQVSQWLRLQSVEVGPQSRVLVLGCGTSLQGVEVAQNLRCEVVNVDFAQSCVSYMRERCSSLPCSSLLTWVVADVTQPMPFPPGHFAAVLDKGTLDAIQCDGKGAAHTAAMLREVSRVLLPGGSFIVTSLHADILDPEAGSTIDAEYQAWLVEDDAFDAAAWDDVAAALHSFTQPEIKELSSDRETVYTYRYIASS